MSTSNQRSFYSSNEERLEGGNHQIKLDNDAPKKFAHLMSPRLSMMNSLQSKRNGTNSLLSGTKSSITPRLFVNQAKKAVDEDVKELSLIYNND
jgi:hypothetical protein